MGRNADERKRSAAAYVRVSSRSQDHAMQRHSIERAAAARGDRVGLWYAEKRSAKTLARPVLDRLRQDAREGKVRKLYVYRLDRLTRSGVRDTLEVVEELRAAGVELVTVADGFDLEGPAAEIVLCVMAWAAKMERLAINERIAAARDRVEAEGGAWGRPRRMDDSQVARVLRLRRRGASLREISIAVEVPRSTIARAVRRG